MARWHVEERHHRDGTKSYRLKVELPPDPLTGRRQARSGTFRTRKEAEKEAVAWVGEVDQGMAVKPSKLTVADVCTQWLHVKRPSLKARTIVHYEHTIAARITPSLGSIPVQKVTPATVDALYGALRAEGCSEDAVHRCHQRLLQLFDYAVKRRIIVANPMLAIDAPTVRSAPPTILTIPQIQTLLTYAAKDGYNPLWLLIVQTGMRRGEALGVRWQDVDLDKGCLQVRQAVEDLYGKPHVTTPKTKAALRTITLFPESIAALRAHRARQNAARLAAGGRGKDSILSSPRPRAGCCTRATCCTT